MWRAQKPEIDDEQVKDLHAKIGELAVANDASLEREARASADALTGLMPIYQKPNASRPARGHKIWPYLLKGLRVERPNQAWAADITYSPMRRDFLYLVAIMD